MNTQWDAHSIVKQTKSRMLASRSWKIRGSATANRNAKLVRLLCSQQVALSAM